MLKHDNGIRDFAYYVTTGFRFVTSPGGLSIRQELKEVIHRFC